MVVVIFQDKGTDFPPITMLFGRYSEAERHIVAEVMRTPPHKTENVVREKVLSGLRTHGTYSMTTEDGSTYVWTIEQKSVRV